MSEFINMRAKRDNFRWELLTTASALALMAYVSSVDGARAEDADRPTVWIELGGQTEFMQGIFSPFIAPFMLKTPTPGPYQDDIFIDGQKPPHFAFGLEGKISFQPEDSDWIFSAALRYGRSNSNRHIHHQSPPPVITSPSFVLNNYVAAYADIKSSSQESHTVLDFSVGKDVGLGRFGNGGTSTISAGVRFAQFSAKSNVEAYGRPTVIPGFYASIIVEPSFNGYSMIAQGQRKFNGVGPSLSWDASAALLGNARDGEVTLDWGINGAVLFGRQKTKLNHTTHAYHLPGSYYGAYNVRSLYRLSHPATRSRSVVVPNLGGFAGISLKFSNAKVSLGYRGDFFFGAMDGGIDTRKTETVGFYGPFATISVGIGG